MHKASGILAAILFLFLGVSSGAAQGFTVGAEGGLGLADFSVDPDVTTESRTNFVFGGVVRYDFAPSGVFGVQSGLNFTQKGTKQVEADTEVEWKLSYLELPLLAAVNIPIEDAKIQPRVYTGGLISFETSCELEGRSPSTTVTVDCDSPDLTALLGTELETSSVDFGLVFGGGFGIEAGSGLLTADVRYDLGLTNINETVGSTTEIKNRVWYFTAGYHYRLP